MSTNTKEGPTLAEIDARISAILEAKAEQIEEERAARERAEREREALLARPYGDLTPDEKVAFTRAKYGGDAA